MAAWFFGVETWTLKAMHLSEMNSYGFSTWRCGWRGIPRIPIQHPAMLRRCLVSCSSRQKVVVSAECFSWFSWIQFDAFQRKKVFVMSLVNTAKIDVSIRVSLLRCCAACASIIPETIFSRYGLDSEETDLCIQQCVVRCLSTLVNGPGSLMSCHY